MCNEQWTMDNEQCTMDNEQWPSGAVGILPIA